MDGKFIVIESFRNVWYISTTHGPRVAGKWLVLSLNPPGRDFAFVNGTHFRQTSRPFIGGTNP